MTIVLDGTTGITTPGEAISGNLSYTGTLTGGTGVVNLGSGQVYKDASGNVGIGTSSPSTVGGTALCVYDGSAPRIRLTNSTTGNTSTVGGELTISGSDFIMENRTASANIRFFNNGAERARINSSGKLLVNTTAESGSNDSVVTIKGTGATGLVRCLALETFVTASIIVQTFRNPNGQVGYIATDASSTQYSTSSDYRLKEDIAPMTGALAKVALLKPCTYKWKVDGSDGQGFIAHELAEVEAGCVTGEKDAVDAEDNPQYQGIDTSFLVATLAAAIQELKAIVDTQAISITALNERLTALEAANV